MDRKKKIERFYVDEFFKVLEIEPDHIEVNEAPDCKVKLDKKTIGIEITGYHSNLKGVKNRPRRQIEEEWLMLQKKIRDEVDKAEYLENTNGILSFKKLELPSKKEHADFIKELIRLAVFMIKNSIENIKLDIRYPALNKYLRGFSLKKVNCYITWNWDKDAEGIGLSEEELINTIKPKLVNYKDSSIDELWLLIYSGHRLSQTMPIRIGHLLRSFTKIGSLLRNSEFDKAFVFQNMFNVIYEWPGWNKIGETKTIPTIIPE